MPSLAAVMTASVVSGEISDTAPTKVVLPTPKPPATTIFTEVVGPAAGVGLEAAKSNENPFQKREVRLPLGVPRLLDADESALGHVPHEDTSDSERHLEQCRDFGHRSQFRAQIADHLVLGDQAVRGAPAAWRRGDQRFDGELVTWAGPSAGDGVRAHER